MRRAINGALAAWAALALLLACSAARAQTQVQPFYQVGTTQSSGMQQVRTTKGLPIGAIVVASCGTPPSTYTAGQSFTFTMDANGNLCTAASVSASITGFAPATTGTPLTATTGGATGTLPAGAVVLAFNTSSTITAYCKLGAAATVGDIQIPPQSWFAYTVGASTQLTCITASSTAVINMVGGSGLATGAGGGGGGGGGGGAVTVADGANVVEGALADAAAAAGGTGTLSAKMRLMTTQLGTINSTLGSPFQAGASIGNTAFIANGPVAGGASASGNPLALGGIYNSTLPSYTTGQRSELQTGTRGSLNVTLFSQDTATAIAASTPADGVSNTGTGLRAWTINNVWNGTTWDRMPGTTAGVLVNPGTAAAWGIGATGAAVPANAQLGAMSQGGNVTAFTGTSGNLNVQCANCSGSGVSTVDAATFTASTSLFAGTGGFFQTTATNNPLTNGQQGMWQMTANRAGFINLRNASGTEIGTSAAEVFVGGRGTAGSAAGGVVTVQGVASMTPVQVSQATAANLNATVTGSGSAGSAATGVVTVQGIASMTPLFMQSSTVPVSTMNSATSNSGVNAALAGVFDDTTPTSISENNFGFVRMSANRNLYGTIRDAAGNERGANVDASNRLTTAPTMVSGSVASGAYASGAFASGALASGSVASGAMVDLGSQADAVCGTATGTCSLIALQKYNNSTNPVLGAGTAYVGKTRATDGTNDAVLDPCQVVAKTNFTGSQTTGTQIIAGTSAKKTYICSMQLIVQAAEVVNIIAGTGTVCATGSSAVMGSTTAANGMSYAANGGFTQGNGAATVIAATAANADNVCITQSGSSRITYQGTYVQL